MKYLRFGRFHKIAGMKMLNDSIISLAIVFMKWYYKNKYIALPSESAAWKRSEDSRMRAVGTAGWVFAAGA